MQKDLDLKKNSLSLYFVIAFGLPIATTLIVVLMAGIPSGLVVVIAMFLVPTIAAMIVVFRSQRFAGIFRRSADSLTLPDEPFLGTSYQAARITILHLVR